jgi:hypothetical protein
MYMQDGKPIQIPYGRKNPGVSKLDLEELILRVIALESRVEKLEKAHDTGQETMESCREILEGDKPRRGRKPKEEIE